MTLNRMLATPLMLVALFVSPAIAADEAALPAALEPFVVDETVVVFAIDATKIDLAAIEGRAVDMMTKALDADEIVEAKKDIRSGIEAIRPWIEQLAKVPGGCIYMLQENLGAGNAGTVFVIPVADDASATAIEKLLDLPGVRDRLPRPRGVQRGQPLPRARIYGAIVVGEQRALDAVKNRDAIERPDLAQALALGDGNAVIRVAFTPDATIRDALPILARQLGLQAGETIDKGVRWIGAAVALPPAGQAVNITVQSNDAAAATTLNDLLVSLIDKAGPNGTPVLKHLQPTVKDDRLVVALDAKGVDAFIDAAIPSLVRARETAVASQSLSQIRQLLLMTIMYANDNKGLLPDDLESLRKYGGPNFNTLLTNPQQPKRKPGYVYVKPREGTINTVNNAAQRLMIYDAFDAWPGRVCVGFADGHAETVIDEARFKELMAAAQAPE